MGLQGRGGFTGGGRTPDPVTNLRARSNKYETKDKLSSKQENKTQTEPANSPGKCITLQPPPEKNIITYNCESFFSLVQIHQIFLLEKEGLKVLREVCFPYICAGLGMVGAGIVLDRSELFSMHVFILINGFVSTQHHFFFLLYTITLA